MNQNPKTAIQSSACILSTHVLPGIGLGCAFGGQIMIEKLDAAKILMLASEIVGEAGQEKTLLAMECATAISKAVEPFDDEIKELAWKFITRIRSEFGLK